MRPRAASAVRDGLRVRERFLEEFVDGATLIDDIARASAVVEVLGIEGYTHEAVEGGGQVAGGDGTVGD